MEYHTVLWVFVVRGCDVDTREFIEYLYHCVGKDLGIHRLLAFLAQKEYEFPKRGIDFIQSNIYEYGDYRV